MTNQIQAQIDKMKVFAGNDTLAATVNLPDIKAFPDPDVRKSLARIAESVGVDYSTVEHTCTAVKGDETTYLATPSVMAENGKAMIIWGGKSYPLKAKDNCEILQINDGKSFICDAYDPENDDNALTIRIRLQKDAPLPNFRKFKTAFFEDPDSLVKILQERISYGKFSDPNENYDFTIKEIKVIPTKRGESEVLITEKGSFWCPAGLSVKEGDSGTYYNDDPKRVVVGEQEAFIRTYAKLRNYEIGEECKVIATSWEESKFGDKLLLTLNDGVCLNANSQIEKYFKSFNPKVDQDHPWTFKISSKRPLTNGHMMVNVSFEMPKDEDDELAQLFSSVQAESSENANQEEVIPF